MFQALSSRITSLEGNCRGNKDASHYDVQTVEDSGSEQTTSSETLPPSQAIDPGKEAGRVSSGIQGVWTDKDTEGHIRNSGIIAPWS